MLAIRLFLFCTTVFLGFCPAALPAMDAKPKTCLEQELIDAIKRGARADTIIRGYLQQGTALNMDYQDPTDGNTPLISAFQRYVDKKDTLDIIECILHRKPTLSIQNNAGQGGYDFARQLPSNDPAAIALPPVIESIKNHIVVHDIGQALKDIEKSASESQKSRLIALATTNFEEFKHQFSHLDRRLYAIRHEILHPVLITFIDGLSKKNARNANSRQDNLIAINYDQSLKNLDYLLNLKIIDINQLIMPSGDLVIIHASKYNAPDLIKLCVAHGADVNRQNKEGYTALMLVFCSDLHQS